MTARDLPAPRTPYDDFYDHDDAAENAFGRAEFAKRSSGVLLAHVRAGRSILTFPRQAPAYDVGAFINAIVAKGVG